MSFLIHLCTICASHMPGAIFIVRSRNLYVLPVFIAIQAKWFYDLILDPILPISAMFQSRCFFFYENCYLRWQGRQLVEALGDIRCIKACCCKCIFQMQDSSSCWGIPMNRPLCWYIPKWGCLSTKSKVVSFRRETPTLRHIIILSIM